MKIAVSVHGRYHGFHLAQGLHERGLLASLTTTYPPAAVHNWVSTNAKLHTAPWLEAWRRIYGQIPIGPKPDLGLARAFGNFAARHATTEGDILVGWSGATLEAIGPAKARGMKVIIERGSTHIAHQTEVLREEYARYGLAFTGTEAEMIAREEEEYALADAIAVPSSHAAKTFTDRGVAPEKIITNLLGVDTERFTYVDRSGRADQPGYKPRILFVGSVGIRKGVPRLLEAFAPLAGQAELHIVGPLEPEMKGLLPGLPTDGVTFRGAVSAAELEKAYADADVFCLPSVEEGFGMVVLEAMATGLPVVISDAVGAADVLKPEFGTIFAFDNADALTDALGAKQWPAQSLNAPFDEGCSWEDYLERAVAKIGKV